MLAMLNFAEWKLLSLVHCESSLFLLSDALSFKCQDSLYKNDFNTFSSRFCQVTYFSISTDVTFTRTQFSGCFCLHSVDSEINLT